VWRSRTEQSHKPYSYAAQKERLLRHYHVRTGNWVREHRGICRLALFPEPKRSDLILWWLWSRNRSDEPKGVFSHRTALGLHELTDLMPAKIDLTVPKGFRRGAPIPRVLRLHHAGVPSSDCEAIDGVPQGIITRTEVRRAAANPNWKTAMQALEKETGK
jgi:hypothetical protein